MDRAAKKKQILASLENKLTMNYGRSIADASKMQIYACLCAVIRDEIMEKWKANRVEELKQNTKQLYYLSVEFLQGRALGNNLLNLAQTEIYQEALADLDISLNEMEDLEPDPGLGNGGLGRLASCFLDSLATLNYAAMGCGIRYEYGLFRQRIINDDQVEVPDTWLDDAGGSYPWEVMQGDDQMEVRFGGHIEESWQEDQMRIHHVGYSVVNAVPYDIPIIGYHTENVACLRLWSAVSPKRLDMQSFSRGDYMSAMQERELAEVISKVLYPDENHIEGKSLRLKQHYFFTSATVQYIIKDFKRRYGKDLTRLCEKISIQINDTHPSLAIPEMMRVLMDLEGYDWDAAWSIVTGVFNYTNHTVMKEALECWPEQLFKELLPRIYNIVKAINEKWCGKLWDYFPGQWEKIGKMAIVGYNEIRMANLCIAASSHVNGVSKLHGDILKQDVFRDFYVVEPWKFLGITNGVTPRRWLMHANPALASLLDESIGQSWRKDLSHLENLLPFAQDAAFREKFAEIKKSNKVRLSNWLRDKQSIAVNPDMIFDVQAKRLHEYKRQMMNILNVISLYDRLMNDSTFDMAPTAFLFGAKASAGYHIAKLTIRLINVIADKIAQAPPRVRERLSVVFLENYNVSLAEMLIPAADVSQQISTAGKEASGTGNMKFMMNGAVTIGTLDGANVEMYELLGDENLYLFGLTAEEVADLYKKGDYSAGQIYSGNASIRHVMDYLVNGELDNGKDRQFHDLYQVMLFGPNGGIADPYLMLKDLPSYSAAHETLNKDYLNRDEWIKKSITNTAKSGIFSSDRTIEEYNKRIWHLNKLNL